LVVGGRRPFFAIPVPIEIRERPDRPFTVAGMDPGGNPLAAVYEPHGRVTHVGVGLNEEMHRLHRKADAIKSRISLARGPGLKNKRRKLRKRLLVFNDKLRRMGKPTPRIHCMSTRALTAFPYFLLVTLYALHTQFITFTAASQTGRAIPSTVVHIRNIYARTIVCSHPINMHCNLFPSLSVLVCPRLPVAKLTNRRNRKINKRAARELLSWSHYKLYQRLQFKKQEYPWMQIPFATEEYTSKTCNNCARMYPVSGKLYDCPSCGYKAHRDTSGAFNILIKKAMEMRRANDYE